MGGFGEPARARLGDVHVVLQTHPELAVDADRRLIGEGHAGPQHGAVALHEIGPLVHVEADAVAGAMGEAGRGIAGAEAGGGEAEVVRDRSAEGGERPVVAVGNATQEREEAFVELRDGPWARGSRRREDEGRYDLSMTNGLRACCGWSQVTQIW